MNEQDRAGCRLTSVSLAGLMLAALAGCAAEKPAAAPQAFGDPSTEVPVAVMLRLDGAGKPVGIDRADPDPVPLSFRGKETAHWFLVPQIDARLEIMMKSGTKPFKNNPKSYGKHALSDPPELGVAGTPYPYTILVTLKDGTKLQLDPIIRVDP